MWTQICAFIQGKSTKIPSYSRECWFTAFSVFNTWDIGLGSLLRKTERDTAAGGAASLAEIPLVGIEYRTHFVLLSNWDSSARSAFISTLLPSELTYRGEVSDEKFTCYSFLLSILISSLNKWLQLETEKKNKKCSLSSHLHFYTWKWMKRISEKAMIPSCILISRYSTKKKDSLQLDNVRKDRNVSAAFSSWNNFHFHWYHWNHRRCWVIKIQKIAETISEKKYSTENRNV